MKINLVMFAAAKEGAGCDQMELEIKDGSTIKDLKSIILERWPDLESLVVRSAFSIDQSYANEDQIIPDAAEVGWIPPVSGG